MHELINRYHRLPTKPEIAAETGLSRKTVHYHTKQLGHERLERNVLDGFMHMSGNVLGKAVCMAMDGDIKAMRLSLQVMGAINR